MHFQSDEVHSLLGAPRLVLWISLIAESRLSEHPRAPPRLSIQTNRKFAGAGALPDCRQYSHHAAITSIYFGDDSEDGSRRCFLVGSDRIAILLVSRSCHGRCHWYQLLGRRMGPFVEVMIVFRQLGLAPGSCSTDLKTCVPSSGGAMFSAEELEKNESSFRQVGGAFRGCTLATSDPPPGAYWPTYLNSPTS